MRVEVVPFERRHVSEAGELLAAFQRAACAGHPVVPDLCAPEVAGRLVAGWQEAGVPAVAALDAGGSLAGFLAANPPAFPGDREARIRAHQHASVAPGRREIYRALYGELARHLVGVGAFTHAISVPTGHRDLLACFFELGFGIDQLLGLRSPSGDGRDGRDGGDGARARGGSAARDARTGAVVVREARADDLPRLLQLTDELQWFHAESPMLRPALLDFAPIEAGFHAALADGRRMLLVAEEGAGRPGDPYAVDAGTAYGRTVGLMQADPDRRYLDTVTIGLAVVTAAARSRGVGSALLAAVLERAAVRGLAAVGTGWTSANPVSDAFWRGNGFVPARCGLVRNVDPRLTWPPTG